MTETRQKRIYNAVDDQFAQTKISYVYLIVVEDIVRYVGRSKNPIKRLLSHRYGILSQINEGEYEYELKIAGIYPESKAEQIEKELIKKFKSSKLLNRVVYKHELIKKVSWMSVTSLIYDLRHSGLHVSHEAVENCLGIAQKTDMPFSYIVSKAMEAYSVD
jgi:predicted GIY-YIG superfamily endonuclease